MAAIALGVVQHEAPFLQMRAERNEADFGGVGLKREHGLGDERLADRHAIKSSDQVPRTVPHFDGMRVAGIMQGLIGPR